MRNFDEELIKIFGIKAVKGFDKTAEYSEVNNKFSYKESFFNFDLYEKWLLIDFFSFEYNLKKYNKLYTLIKLYGEKVYEEKYGGKTKQHLKDRIVEVEMFHLFEKNNYKVEYNKDEKGPEGKLVKQDYYFEIKNINILKNDYIKDNARILSQLKCGEEAILKDFPKRKDIQSKKLALGIRKTDIKGAQVAITNNEHIELSNKKFKQSVERNICDALYQLNNYKKGIAIFKLSSIWHIEHNYKYLISSYYDKLRDNDTKTNDAIFLSHYINDQYLELGIIFINRTGVFSVEKLKLMLNNLCRNNPFKGISIIFYHPLYL